MFFSRNKKYVRIASALVFACVGASGLVACAPNHDVVRARAAQEFECSGQPISTHYIGEERYAAGGCGKSGVFRCARRLADDAVLCTLEEGSLAVVAPAPTRAPLPIAAAPQAPTIDPRSCEMAAEYDERARKATNPAKQQFERMAQTSHKNCDALNAAPAAPNAAPAAPNAAPAAPNAAPAAPNAAPAAPNAAPAASNAAPAVP